MVCREQVGSGWGNVLRTTETQKAKSSGVREVPRILRSVVHAKPSGVREVPRILRSVVHFGNLAGNQRSRRDGMSRARGVGAASAGPNRRSRRDGVSRARGVGAASAGPNRRSRRDGVSRASGGGVASATPGVVSAVRMRWMVPETHEGPAPQA